MLCKRWNGVGGRLVPVHSRCTDALDAIRPSIPLYLQCTPRDAPAAAV